MTTRGDVYVVIYEHPADDCALPHAYYFATEQEAIRCMNTFSNEGVLSVVRGFTVAVRGVAQYPTAD